MSWLGKSGYSREEMSSLGDAYAQILEGSYKAPAKPKAKAGPTNDTSHLDATVKAKPSSDSDSNLNRQEEYAALADAYAMMYEKKKSGSDKCGEGTYWDKEEKKCKSKKKSGGGGRAIFYGGHSHGHDDEEGESEGGSDGAAAGAAAAGGGGGE